MLDRIFSLEKFFFVTSLMVILMISHFSFSSKILVFYSVILSLRLIFIFKKSPPVIILLIFISLYISPFFSHFFQGYEVSVWKSFNNSYYLNQVLSIFSIFICSIFVFTKKCTHYTPIIKRLNITPSNSIFYASIIIGFFLAHFGLKGESLLSGLNYALIDKQRSPLFEYTLIFFLTAFIHSKRNKTQYLFLFALSLFVILKDFLYGGRVTSLMLILLIYLINYEYRIKTKYLFVFMILALFLLSLISFIRSAPLIFLEGKYDFNLFYEYYFSVNQNTTLNSNEGDVAHSSARILGMIETNIITTMDRFKSFLYFAISVFTPGISISELSNLAAYKKDMYQGGGGLLFPISFYTWMSYPGVILSGFFVSRMIKSFIETKRNALIVYLLLFFSTFPRWFSYSPIIVFKLCFYGLLVYVFFNSLKKMKKVEHCN